MTRVSIVLSAERRLLTQVKEQNGTLKADPVAIPRWRGRVDDGDHLVKEPVLNPQPAATYTHQTRVEL